jgi:hypothetical protein
MMGRGREKGERDREKDGRKQPRDRGGRYERGERGELEKTA